MENSTISGGSSNQTLYVGLGVGIGVTLLVGIAAMCILIVHKIRQHRRQTQLLEQGQLDTGEVEQRRSHDIRSSLGIVRSNSLRAQHQGFDALSSTESLHHEGARKSRIPSIHLPKKTKKRGIQLKRLKHLSAITESPRSKCGQSPALPTIRHIVDMPQVAEQNESQVQLLGYAETADIAIPANGPKGFHVFDDDRPMPARSVSVGALIGPGSALALTAALREGHRRSHMRSVSLGGQPPEQLPPDPIALPVIAPHDPTAFERRLSADSISSEESASSSLLMKSPSVCRTYRKTPPRPRRPQHRVEPVPSIDDAPVSPLSENGMKHDLPSSSSISSFDDDINTSSFRRVTNVNRPSKTRVSPALSGQDSTGKRSNTARRVSRSVVSVNGSPTQRSRPGVLRDLSSNSILPSRQHSNATSTNSSDGNPFQWDSIPLHKPSAMKGSPNARKGHKRQNCVRISLLTPQVLGPPPSRSTSPGISYRISEEDADDVESQADRELRFTAAARTLRPLSSAGSAPNLRIQTLRASLTPSSPTLSLWNAYQDRLPSQPSDSHLTTSTISREASNVSSAFSIPSFPSPSKTTVSEVQRTEPTPEFYVSRPLEESCSSPFDMPGSSPPVLTPTRAEYDPALPPMPKFDVEQFRKYDPASPALPSRTTASTASLDMSSSGSRYEPRFEQVTAGAELTSGNASSVMAQVPLFKFPGAPVLSPPHDDNPVPAPLWIRRSPESSVPSLSVSQPTDESPRVSGPRTEPPKSILKHAMALRRMNSEIDTNYCRESRRYLQLGREGSPQLPMYGSPQPSQDEFDFGFDSHDEDTGTDAGIVTGTRFCRETSSFYGDLPTIAEINSYAQQMPRRGGNKRHGMNAREWDRRPLSIMDSPQSLYGADGFLRSDC